MHCAVNRTFQGLGPLEADFRAFRVTSDSGFLALGLLQGGSCCGRCSQAARPAQTRTLCARCRAPPQARRAMSSLAVVVLGYLAIAVNSAAAYTDPDQSKPDRSIESTSVWRNTFTLQSSGCTLTYAHLWGKTRLSTDKDNRIAGIICSVPAP